MQNQNQYATWSHAFSRAWRRSRVFACNAGVSCRWLIPEFTRRFVEDAEKGAQRGECGAFWVAPLRFFCDWLRIKFYLANGTRPALSSAVGCTRKRVVLRLFRTCEFCFDFHDKLTFAICCRTWCFYKPSGLQRWSILHEATRSIATPLDGMLVHRRLPPEFLSGCPNNSPVPICTPGWREALWKLSVLPKNTTQWPRPALEPRPLGPESNAQTIRSPRLPMHPSPC